MAETISSELDVFGAGVTDAILRLDKPGVLSLRIEPFAVATEGKATFSTRR